MRLRYLVASGLSLLVSHSALAASVRVDYSGFIHGMSGEFGSLTGSFEVGTRFSGHFTFDDSSAPTFSYPEAPYVEEPFSPGGRGAAGYEFSSSVWGFHFELGAISADADVPVEFSPTGGYSIGLYDYELGLALVDSPSTVFAYAIVGEQPPNPSIAVLIRTVSVVLNGGELGLPLHSTVLAAVPWSLSAFADSRVQLEFTESDDNSPYAPQVYGTIDELTVSVPEPASAALAALAGLALTVLGLVRERR